MFRRIITVGVVLVASFSGFGQDAFTIPDYREIENLTQDKSSAFFYPELFKRYISNDTNLTLRDYRILYYGYFFQPGYSPFMRTTESDSLRRLLISKEEPTSADWNEIIRLGNGNLKKNPFDLKGLNVVWLAYRHSGDSATARFYFDKLKKLVQTILSSGDGLSEKTAFHVLSVAHEYDVINILGYEFGGSQSLTSGKCDYLSVKENEENAKGFYFDVNQIFLAYQKSSSKE